MIKHNFIYKLFLAGFFGFGLLIPALSQAQITDAAVTSYKTQLEAGAVGAGLTTAEDAKNPIDPRILAGQIIKVILQVLGTYFVILVVLGGYRLIKADGDTSKIEQGKETIQKAIVGLLIILASYSLATFATKQTIQAINNAGPKTGFDQQL
ncbi:MAG: hypothetical protein A2821_04100 [Candidatus Magasanikbacteria bacterium RIFCSPHIGHO2_01_FULL_41_23]|uniref:Uncharacterized protein n=1 Tax=Candidatus Magasanikbacteria bacterium RIFCSPLOWO2_01_FULL_40_15 TaxID=1798686 RepID=A0A1F6N372_9BACT|nr:MAG: hypothetical protein A2821_04100 [Candidatus Magasanikbacteria bacterium RIFCSPHIGHO2_01_FULL_41_23]OGH76349.1 MAG: hypothetical protein A3F22_04435 [Candidatus Magasanikbacteria bacterium RIFCSPHIGHO2_12_FULL_41_16]OGH78341.1 MAG: hypothetical protein A2983_01100 [Candidatus Magasanikbacteria bacterium RIFCSPLOWO2_01_FULL_40_15]